MALTTNSLFDIQSQRIQEIINRSVHVFLSEYDPIWRDVIQTSEGVGNKAELGRDLKMIKVFMGSFAGVLDTGTMYSEFNLYGDLVSQMGGQMHLQQLNQTYPDPRTGPNATPYRLAVDLRSLPANIMLTLGEKQAEATPAFIGQVIAPKLMGFARMIGFTLANYFYLSQNDSYVLCTVTAKSAITEVTGGVASVYRFTFTPNNYACNRFARGMRIDFYDADGGDRDNDSAAEASQTAATRLNVLVESVDALHGTVTCISQTNPASAWTTTLTNGQLVTHANTKLTTGSFYGIAGIRSWLKAGTGGNDNYLLGAEKDSTDYIDVTLNPEFMSFQKNVAGVLTEHKLRQYLRRCHAAWSPMGHFLDCLIASDGVWLAYEAQKIGMARLDRTGKLSSLQNEGSQDGVSYTFDGRNYTGYTSQMVESGAMYGVKKSNQNWKKYVPPTPAGVSKMREADPFVPFEFVAGAITGGSSNQLPMYLTASGDASAACLVSEGSQLPGRCRLQMVPDQPNMMRLYGLTEDRVYSDSS